jgi:hypothetical protein
VSEIHLRGQAALLAAKIILASVKKSNLGLLKNKAFEHNSLAEEYSDWNAEVSLQMKLSWFHRMTNGMFIFSKPSDGYYQCKIYELAKEYDKLNEHCEELVATEKQIAFCLENETSMTLGGRIAKEFSEFLNPDEESEDEDD